MANIGHKKSIWECLFPDAPPTHLRIRLVLVHSNRGGGISVVVSQFFKINKRGGQFFDV